MSNQRRNYANIPFIGLSLYHENETHIQHDITIPIPQEEIMVTAATTAFISVAATLTATSLFKHCVKVFKPIIMQLAKRIQKKLNGNTTKEEPAG